MTTINSSPEKITLGLGEYILDFSAPGISQAIIDVTTAGLEENQEIIFYRLNNDWLPISSLNLEVVSTSQIAICVNAVEVELEVTIPEGTVEITDVLTPTVYGLLENFTYIGSVVPRDWCTELRTDRFAISVDQIKIYSTLK